MVAAVAVAVPSWWRRRAPLWSLLGLSIGLGVAAAVGGVHPSAIALAAVVHLYAVGAWSARRRLVLGLVVGLAALLVVGALTDSTDVVAAVTLPATLVVLPAALGHAARSRRLYVAEVERRLAEAESDRDARAREAVVEERIRIARELHDVVAHHVSLIGVQAGAARTALDHDPDAARGALTSIEDASRLAVGEMRQLLGLLDPRPGVDPPQPGLDALPALVGRWRDAGLEVDARLSGDPTAVAPVVSSCCYRSWRRRSPTRHDIRPPGASAWSSTWARRWSSTSGTPARRVRQGRRGRPHGGGGGSRGCGNAWPSAAGGSRSAPRATAGSPSEPRSRRFRRDRRRPDDRGPTVDADPRRALRRPPRHARPRSG